MDDNAIKALNDVVRQHLPSAVGDMLKKELERLADVDAMAGNDAKRIEELTDSLKRVNAKNAELNAKLVADAAMVTETAKLKADLEARERTLIVTLHKASADAAIARSNDLFTILSMLMRNTEFRESRFTSAMVPVAYSGGANCMGGVSMHTETRNKTTTKEQA